MKNKNKFSIKGKIKSFGYALKGLKIVLKEEHNAWIYLLAIFLIIVFGIYFELNSYEWLFQFIIVVVLLVAEIFNSSIESLVDLLSPEIHPLAKKAKDLSSAAVLLSAIGSLVIFFVIYIPKLIC